MSPETTGSGRSLPGRDRFGTLTELPLPRAIALAGAFGLVVSFLLVLYDVVSTVGDPLFFYPVVILPLFAATVLARFIRVVAALAIGVVLFVGGLSFHIATLSTDLHLLVVLDNNLELLTGRTVLAIEQADVWALAVAPTPVFVTWFLALRRWYVGSAAVGGGMLGFLVLTGDAGTMVTLVGVVATGAMLAFGDIDEAEWSSAADRAAVLLAVMVLAPLLITIVPGGAASPVTFLGSEEVTMEENILTSDTDLEIVGAIEQSSEERFTVRSDQPHLWRANSFDRYTGDGWVRTGTAQAYEGGLEGPPGETERLNQTFEAESELESLPAAWRPVNVSDNVAGLTRVTSAGGLSLDGTLIEGTEYRVTSAIPDPSVESLTEAGADYPDDIFESYTQLPASTPDRVAERTDHIIQNADNSYEAALIIEDWLKTNRGYSLDVDRPDGDIADAFLFEMNEGYCTYFATTMVTMLRTEGIPARLATGYTTGQQVADDEYLVRGLNSHAWVEVYFPDVGWVAFDPTPPDPREQAEQAALEQQGGGSGGGAVVREVANDPETTDPDDPAQPPPLDTPDLDDSDAPAVAGEPAIEQPEEGPAIQGPDDGSGEGSSSRVPVDPSREQFLLGAVALFGIVAGIRQTGAAHRVSRALAIRFQRRSDPATDVERAYDRLLLILENRHRPRETGETMRQYLDDIGAGPKVKRAVELREQARYAETVSEDAADEAVDLVDSIRRDG